MYIGCPACLFFDLYFASPIVMAHSNASLKQVVQRLGQLDCQRAARYTQEVAHQLAELHREGRFHNDVCPRNILLDDLGVGRSATHRALPDADDYNVVQGEHAAEIADYLAPEQALNSGSINGRADIYSLGCTLYFR